MPYTPLKIHIPEPCGENWEAMSPVADTSARHCDSCAKNVVDFTGFTDAQTHAYMRESKGKLCGRFRPDQLGRPLRAAGQPTSPLLRVAASAAGLLLAATGCEGSEITQQSATTDSAHAEGAFLETLSDGLVFDPPMTGEIEPMEDEIEMTVPGMVKGGPPTPPPPPPLKENSFFEYGEPVFEETGPVSEPAVPHDAYPEEDLVGDIDIDWGQNPPPVVQADTAPVPPPPPPPPFHGEVMGVIIYVPPTPTGITDTLRNILNPPADTALQPPAHPRPRPDLAPTYLQNLEPYPNPFVDEITLELDAPEKEGLNIELLDASGRRILTQSWELASGFNRLVLLPRQRKLKGQLFYLRLITESGRVITKTIVRR